MLSYKYYLNTVTRNVSKHTATALQCYHINITLTQSHLPSPSAAIQPVFSHCAVTRHIINVKGSSAADSILMTCVVQDVI